MSDASTKLVGTVDTHETTAGDKFTTAQFEKIVDPSLRVEPEFGADPDALTALKMENRIGVLPTHGVDASIIHSTAYETAKQNRTKKQPLWFRQVFDALILDIGSYEEVANTANRKFIENNKNWNQFEEGLKAITAVQKEVLAEAKARPQGYKYDVSPNGEYGEFFNALKNLNSVINSTKKRDLTDFQLSRGQKDALKVKLRKLGFDPQKGMSMTPEQFYFAYLVFLDASLVKATITSFGRKAQSEKQKVIKMVEEQTKELFGEGSEPYKSVLQYG